MRWFSSIAPPEEVRAPIRRSLDALALTDLRLVAEARWHVTVAFFGAVPEAQVQPLVDALGSVAVSTAPFDVQLDGAGAFPGGALWLGVAPTAELDGLWSAVAEATAGLGSTAARRRREMTQRPVPHLTVARASRDRRSAARAVPALAELGIRCTWRVGSLELMTSDGGSPYAVRSSHPFVGPT